MKKLITILFVLIAFIAQSQDTKPNNPELKKLIAPNTPIFYFNPIDSAVWIFKGAYGWTKLADSARVYRELEKKENISNKVISISGASTNIQYPSAKLLYDQLALKEPTQTKGNLTESVTGLQFNATRQVIGGAADLSLSSGYVIPTTTDVANWNNASADTRVKATLVEAVTGIDDTKYITPLSLIDVGKLLYVPYTNANSDVNLGNYGLTGDTINATSKLQINGVNVRNDWVTDAIVDGVTTVAPSQNAVFDALALKAPIASPTFTGTVTTPNLKVSGFTNADYVLKTNADGTIYTAALAASQVYKGTWNATTNTPTLANGTGTSGWYYRVTVAGTVNFGAGNITFSVGDDVSYNGSIWERIPAATIMGNPLTKTDDTNITLTLGGSPTTALVNAASMTLGWTGTLADSRITSSGNWNSAYNDKVNSLAVTGDATKTITLTQQDGGTVTGTFTDNNTTYDLSPYRLKSDTVLLSGTASNYNVSLKENILTFGTGLNRTGNTITNTITQFTTANEIDHKYAADSSYMKSHVRNDLDLSPTNELQTISTTGAAGNITLSNSGGTLNLNVNDADSDPTNELQTLSKVGSTISLSGGGGSITDDNTTYSAGTGMSLVGTTFNNTLPDQVVSLTQGGATSITGTYPNFTISSPSEQYVGTVTSVFAGNGLTQTGTATINPTINVNSHAGTAGAIGTVNIGADAIGVNLGNTSITAMRGDYGTAAYDGRISSLTTTGSSGAATFASNVLNVPNYTLSGLGGQTQLNGTGFVKATGTTISYDNTTYKPTFTENTGFNKNFGTTSGTVLEGRTFGTAANNNTGDFEVPLTFSTGLLRTGNTITNTITLSGLGAQPLLEYNETIVSTAGVVAYVLPFTLKTTTFVWFNGTLLKQSNWSGVGTTTLTLLVNTEIYDTIKIQN